MYTGFTPNLKMPSGLAERPGFARTVQLLREINPEGSPTDDDFTEAWQTLPKGARAHPQAKLAMAVTTNFWDWPPEKRIVARDPEFARQVIALVPDAYPVLEYNARFDLGVIRELARHDVNILHALAIPQSRDGQVTVPYWGDVRDCSHFLQPSIVREIPGMYEELYGSDMASLHAIRGLPELQKLVLEAQSPETQAGYAAYRAAQPDDVPVDHPARRVVNWG